MTVILFLIDNSPSMNQRTYFGPSLLDFSKASIETFYKLAGWKQNDSRKISQVLEKIKCTGTVSLETGISRCFNLLNLNRLQLGYENYGYGLYPSYSEPAIVICITHDSNSPTIQVLHNDTPQNPILKNIPGEEYSQSIYRWDYRLFSLSLSIPGIVDNVKEFKNPSGEEIDDSLFSELIRSTGGEKFFALDSRSLQVSLEKLSEKCQSGVVVNLIVGNIQLKQFLYVRHRGKIGSTWPFPDLSWFSDTIVTGTLTSRPVQPNVHVSMDSKEAPDIKDFLPFDRYELEPSYLSKLILAKKDSESIWECSSVHPVTQAMCPFAFLRASSDLQTVHLFVLSFNYPHLLKLFNEVNLGTKISELWMIKMQEYLNDIPRYYLVPLSKLFERIGLNNLIRQDFSDKILPYQIKQNLQKLRQTAKLEYERIVQIVESCIDDAQCFIPQIKGSLQNGSIIEVNQITSYRYPLRQEIFQKLFFDPCEAPRGYLRELIPKMRKNLISMLKTSAPLRTDNLNIFNQPISEMGDYINYKFRNKDDILPNLREINPSPERADTFGNPFRKKSSQLNSTFVIDEGFVGDAALNHSQAKKKTPDINSHLIRTKGPIPLSMNAKNWRNWSKKYGIASPYHNSFDSNPSSPENVPTKQIVQAEEIKEQTNHESSKLIEMVRNAENMIRSPVTDQTKLFEVIEKISMSPNETHRNNMCDFLMSIALVYSKVKLAKLISFTKSSKESKIEDVNDIVPRDINVPQTESNVHLTKNLKRKLSPIRGKLLIKSKLLLLTNTSSNCVTKKRSETSYDTSNRPSAHIQRANTQKTVNGSH